MISIWQSNEGRKFHIGHDFKPLATVDWDYFDGESILAMNVAVKIANLLNKEFPCER